jgi:membrane protease YdiL (CAAX protease family)
VTSSAVAVCPYTIPISSDSNWSNLSHFDAETAVMRVGPNQLVELLLPMLFIRLRREKWSEYGLGAGDFRTGLKLTGLFYVLYIPCFLLLFTNDAFQAYYGGIGQRIHTWPEFIRREALSTFMLCLRTEFLFRGFILFAVARAYGPWAGVLAGIIPYVLIHTGKAPIEAFGSLLVGMALAWLALKTRSVWYGILLHGSIALLFNAAILLASFLGR